MEGIRRALVLCLGLIAGTTIEQAPSIGPHILLCFFLLHHPTFLLTCDFGYTARALHRLVFNYNNNISNVQRYEFSGLYNNNIHLL